jgi:hypothetical protein
MSEHTKAIEACIELTQHAGQLRKGAAVLSEVLLQVAEAVKNGALPMPEQPISWAEKVAADMETQAQAIRACVQKLRPFVSAELTAELATELDASRAKKKATGHGN